MSRAVIRLARPGDAGAILGIYAPIVRETPISFEVEPPGEAEMADRIRATLAWGPWLVCEGGEGILGWAAASRFRERAAYGWTVEASAYVASGARRRGIGTALSRELLAALRRQGYRLAVAVVTLPNPASLGLLERVGFEPAGVLRRAGFKLGRWWDVALWQAALADGGAPSAPCTLSEVGLGEEWSVTVE